MPTPFIMPKVDMDQEKATIISWSKAEGDEVKQDETVLVVETDKIAIDVTAPATGKLVDIRFKEGDVVPVATVIAYVLGKGETLADIPDKASPTVAISTAAAAPTEPAKPAANASPIAIKAAQELGVDINAVPASGSRISREDVELFAKNQSKETMTQFQATSGKVAATPSARRLANEAGIALNNLTGSGPRGRIQAHDVTAQIALQPATSSPAAQPVSATSSGERTAKIIPLSTMRQKIADRLQASFRDIPHIFLTVKADVTRLEDARSRLNEIAARQSQGKVTLTAMLVKVIAWALERNPYLNSSLVDQNIHLWEDVNVGIAAALEEGLIVPVVRNANRLSIRQISEEITGLSQRAREGKLGLNEVKSGTFTLTNLGMFGIPQFNAVINPPECAILAAGAVVRKPVVIDEMDTVEVRPIISLTLSADHRIVDGVVAARFLNDLVQAIESPETML